MTRAAIADTITALIPETHHEAGHRAVTVDGEAAGLASYERRDGRNAGLEEQTGGAVFVTAGGVR